MNKENQLRIISMQKGAYIGVVFERLSRAAAHIETVAKLSHDDCLGYIISCSALHCIPQKPDKNLLSGNSVLTVSTTTRCIIVRYQDQGIYVTLAVF